VTLHYTQCSVGFESSGFFTPGFLDSSGTSTGAGAGSGVGSVGIRGDFLLSGVCGVGIFFSHSELKMFTHNTKLLSLCQILKINFT
jgi:hypothetical protein